MSEYEVLDWEGLSPFFYEGLVRKKEIADGSCFFHCIADAFYEPYMLGQKNKKEFVRNLRKELSIMLASKNKDGVVWYNTLSRGKLQEYSNGATSFSLQNMVALLDSNNYVDNRFNEFVSNAFDKDIYIINYDTKDVYVTGKDDDILYKDRKSIVLIWYQQNHFDLAGVLYGNILKTTFEPDHGLILSIKSRLKDITK